MKLARITKPRRSAQVRVMLSGDLTASLEHYAQYYEHIHGDTKDTRALIPEILRAFLDADREFQSWSRSAERQPYRIPAPSPSNGRSRHRRDLPHRGTGGRASHVFTTDTSLIPLDEPCVPQRTRPIGKWREPARFSVHASVYGAPTRAKHVSLSLRNH